MVSGEGRGGEGRGVLYLQHTHAQIEDHVGDSLGGVEGKGERRVKLTQERRDGTGWDWAMRAMFISNHYDKRGRY